MSLLRNTSHHLHYKKRYKCASPVTALCAITHVAHQFGFTDYWRDAARLRRPVCPDRFNVHTGRLAFPVSVKRSDSLTLDAFTRMSSAAAASRHLQIQSLSCFYCDTRQKSTRKRLLDIYIHITPASHDTFNVCKPGIRHIHEDNTKMQKHVRGGFHHFLCLAPSGSNENKEKNLVICIYYYQRQTPEKATQLPHTCIQCAQSEEHMESWCVLMWCLVH